MKLSIITPSYNQGKFIADTFNSILNQKINFDLEYILVDAKSTDATSSVVKKFAPLFKKRGITFIYICEKDKGQSDAINKGFRAATGNIVTYLNSDDFYEENILHKVMQYFSVNPTVDWAYGGWNFINENKLLYKSSQPLKFKRSNLLDYCNIGQPSCFFRKGLLKKVGFLNENLHLTMDYDLWLKFSLNSPAGIMPFIISNMRYYANAKSGSQTMQHLIETFKLSTTYSNTYSRQRIRQILFLLRGFVIILLKKDITRRITKNFKK